MSPPPIDHRASQVPQPSISVHYMASRLRIDSWDNLREAAQKLAEMRHRGSDGARYDDRIRKALAVLRPIEQYWAFPGRAAFENLVQLYESGDFEEFGEQAGRIVRLLVSGAYRRRNGTAIKRRDFREADVVNKDPESKATDFERDEKPYFEILLVDDVAPEDLDEVRESILNLRREEDPFFYDVVVVPSFEDALIGILFNYNIQSCVIRYTFPFESGNQLDVLKQYLELVDAKLADDLDDEHRGFALGEAIKKLRPELDCFLVTEAPVEEVAGRAAKFFRRVFYRQEDYTELHLSILKGISERYRTPFFAALKAYAAKPTGVFHAMPISRGKSIGKSNWIQDLGRFYGENIFQAETSATTGGLDSLLQPSGPLKEAQALAARAFRARRTFFVTNGTSTANKIVLQAVCRPGDIVLVDRDCHKSHHYGLILSGALPCYLDSYPLDQFSMYGAVPLREIKRQLMILKRAGKLDRVRMLLLTNCTFDGITYHPERVMMEVLAIKPDMIFLWDEAWFAFASNTPISRLRTGMECAACLRERFRSPEYRHAYASWLQEFEQQDLEKDGPWLEGRLMPDPDLAKVRVYSTQSTHKTLTALRQGSMIHIFDQLYERHVADSFHEAYMTHTSTSPNYQILASLDVGRRQVELEGYELVQKSIELAMTLREQIRSNPLLRRFFEVLGPRDMIPQQLRESGLELYFDPKHGYERMEEAWRVDEFALDPTRITLHVGRTGMDGDTFKKHLMERFDIQINKTSRNTVLFMIHIGSNRGTVAYLIEVLTKIAQELVEQGEDRNRVETDLFAARVRALTEEMPPLPHFSYFHRSFRPDGKEMTTEGDMRAAFFLAYDEDACDYLKMDGSIEAAMDGGREVVSASFVIPYPPGFPILVPGQVISRDILAYLKALDVKEIHGYNPQYGLRVFREEALAARAPKGLQAQQLQGRASSNGKEI